MTTTLGFGRGNLRKPKLRRSYESELLSIYLAARQGSTLQNGTFSIEIAGHLLTSRQQSMELAMPLDASIFMQQRKDRTSEVRYEYTF